MVYHSTSILNDSMAANSQTTESNRLVIVLRLRPGNRNTIHTEYLPLTEAGAMESSHRQHPLQIMPPERLIIFLTCHI